MSFPGQPSGFPKPMKTRRRRAAKRAEPIPEEERTHVPRNRFAFVCGRKRLGVEKALVVLEKPTCDDCAGAIRAEAKRERSVRELLDKLPTTDW